MIENKGNKLSREIKDRYAAYAKDIREGKQAYKKNFRPSINFSGCKAYRIAYTAYVKELQAYNDRYKQLIDNFNEGVEIF